MNKTRLLLLTLLVFVIHTMIIMLTCGWLFSWVYTLPPTEVWLPKEVMMSSQTLLNSNLLTLVMSFFFVYVYAVIYKGVPGKTWSRGLTYGALLWLITGVGMSSMMLFMAISPTVVIYWIIQALVISLISGSFVGGLYKVK